MHAPKPISEACLGPMTRGAISRTDQLATPYPNHVARWVADELIIPTRGHLDHAQ